MLKLCRMVAYLMELTEPTAEDKRNFVKVNACLGVFMALHFTGQENSHYFHQTTAHADEVWGYGKFVP